jgi:periplasmic protein TonB
MKITFLFIILSLSFFQSGFAQETMDSVAAKSTESKVVEVAASVDKEEWRAHLVRELTPIVNKASKKLSPGQYTVNVRFLVERDGSISNCVAMNDPGYNIGAKVAAIVEKGPKWTPGSQNGVVRSYHTQPIVFVITK